MQITYNSVGGFSRPRTGPSGAYDHSLDRGPHQVEATPRLTKKKRLAWTFWQGGLSEEAVPQKAEQNPRAA